MSTTTLRTALKVSTSPRLATLSSAQFKGFITGFTPRAFAPRAAPLVVDREIQLEANAKVDSEI